jgi:hypothetical protein
LRTTGDFAGDGQAVFVVEGGVVYLHRHIALGQGAVVERLQGAAVTGVVFV